MVLNLSAGMGCRVDASPLSGMNVPLKALLPSTMLTHRQIDDGTYRGEHTLYCVDVHALLKTPVSELSSLRR